jgi:NADPH:quinone reductase-like Zn-dependent oxidoreductase
MKALIFRETGEPKSVLQLADTPTPPLAPGEALVRVLLSPIHASDLHMVRGRYDAGVAVTDEFRGVRARS